jgi:hypothetical protein
LTGKTAELIFSFSVHENPRHNKNAKIPAGNILISSKGRNECHGLNFHFLGVSLPAYGGIGSGHSFQSPRLRRGGFSLLSFARGEFATLFLFISPRWQQLNFTNVTSYS